MFPTTPLLEQTQASLFQDLKAFLPELLLITGMVVMLLVRVFTRTRQSLLPLAMLTALVACLSAVGQWFAQPDLRSGIQEMANSSTYRGWGPSLATALGWVVDGLPSPDGRNLFTGLLRYDAFGVFLHILLTGLLLPFFALCWTTGLPDREDSADFAILILGATLGMLLMTSAQHLLMVFIAIEMASLPSYALAGFVKGRRGASEAALKYVIFGAASAGVMLYGISLITLKLGTGNLAEIAQGYQQVVAQQGHLDAILLAGTLFVLVGLGFKLAAVPFHFWCPDVFEGASAEVAGFLSVASKAAAVALTIRLGMTLTGNPDSPAVLRQGMMFGLGLLGALTMTFGNLAAFGQRNLKRLLAYSTIAHAGTMLLGVATLSLVGNAAVLFYMIAYVLMNLGAFAVVAVIRNAIRSEQLQDYAGLMERLPFCTIALIVFLVSLLGLPPLAGFAAKFQIFAGLFAEANAWSQVGESLLSRLFGGLLLLGALNTVLSTAYYLRVVRVMVLEEAPSQAILADRPSLGSRLVIVLLLIGVLVVGIVWGPLAEFSRQAADTPMAVPSEAN